MRKPLNSFDIYGLIRSHYPDLVVTPENYVEVAKSLYTPEEEVDFPGLTTPEVCCLDHITEDAYTTLEVASITPTEGSMRMAATLIAQWQYWGMCRECFQEYILPRRRVKSTITVGAQEKFVCC
jgi:hypothetical protein